MEIFELIIFIIAYTVGVITLFLELICYKRRIEYLETILFSAAFLLLIISLSVTHVFDLIHQTSENRLNIFVSLSMVLLALFTPINIFAERQVKVTPLIRRVLFIASGLLFLMIIADQIFRFIPFMDLVVNNFLAVTVISSMLIIRNSKPEQRIKHREKIERGMAVLFLLIMPLTLFVDIFAKKLQFLNAFKSDISITVPILFIILAASKFLDDLTRLSLFNPDNSLKQQNADNYNLTKREREIAELLIRGYSYTRIGETLFISIPTVKTHVTNMYKKMQVSNKMGLFNALTN